MKEKYTFKNFINDIIEIISYITWTASIFIFTYCQVNLNGINEMYQKSIFVFYLSCISLFKLKHGELTKEIIKTSLILLVTDIIKVKLGAIDVNLHNEIYLGISNIMYSGLGYITLLLFRNNFKLHGKKAYFLDFLLISSIYTFLFIFKANPYVSVGIPISCNLVIGLRTWIIKSIKDKKEREEKERQQKEQEEQEKKEKYRLKKLEEAEKENKELKKKLKESLEKNNKLTKENKKLKKKMEVNNKLYSR